VEQWKELQIIIKMAVGPTALGAYFSCIHCAFVMLHLLCTFLHTSLCVFHLMETPLKYMHVGGVNTMC